MVTPFYLDDPFPTLSMSQLDVAINWILVSTRLPTWFCTRLVVCLWFALTFRFYFHWTPIVFSGLTLPFLLPVLLCNAWGWLQREEYFDHHIWKTDFNSKLIVTACLSWYIDAMPGLDREEWTQWFARAIEKVVWDDQGLPSCLSFLWPFKILHEVTYIFWSCPILYFV